MDLMFRHCLVRKPTDRERQFLIEVFESEHAALDGNRQQLKELTGQWQSGKSIDQLELGAWFRVAEILLNLDEMITRV